MAKPILFTCYEFYIAINPSNALYVILNVVKDLNTHHRVRFLALLKMTGLCILSFIVVWGVRGNSELSEGYCSITNILFP